MPDPGSYVFDLPAKHRPVMFKLPDEWYPGVQGLWGTSSTKRVVDPILGIRAIVIHATSAMGSAGAMCVMKAGKASWHWLVPNQNEHQHGEIVWACTPEARAAWHVRPTRSHPMVNDGAKRVNHWSLGVAIVNADTPTAHPFSIWQIEVTAAIVRYCWAKYPNLRTVVSHAALAPEERAGTHFDWWRFKALVLNSSDGTSVPPLVSAARPVSLLGPSSRASYRAAFAEARRQARDH